MKRMLKFIPLLLLIPAIIFADAVIFSGGDVKTLKPNIQLLTGSKILSGTVNPAITAVSANKGSLYLNTSDSNIYKKNDNGSTTNWSVLESSFGTTTLDVSTITADYVSSSVNDVILCSASAQDINVTLPSASTMGLLLRVKKIDYSATSVTLVAVSGQTIEGDSTLTITDGGISVDVISDGGSSWFVH